MSMQDSAVIDRPKNKKKNQTNKPTRPLGEPVAEPCTPYIERNGERIYFSRTARVRRESPSIVPEVVAELKPGRINWYFESDRHTYTHVYLKRERVRVFVPPSLLKLNPWVTAGEKVLVRTEVRPGFNGPETWCVELQPAPDEQD